MAAREAKRARDAADAERQVAAAQLYGRLLQAAPDLLPQALDLEARARGGVLSRWLDAGLPVEEALRRAEAELPSDGMEPLLGEEEMAVLKLETKDRLKGEESQSTIHRVIAQLEDLFLNELGAGQNIRTARNAVRRALLRQTLTDVNPENSLILSNSDQSRRLSFTTAQTDDVGSNVGDLRVETQRDGSSEDDNLIETNAGFLAGNAVFQREGRDGQAFSGFSVAANDLKSNIADGTDGAYDEFGVVDFGRKSRPQRSRLETAERLEKALYNSLYEDRLHPAQGDPGRRAIAAKKQARAIAAMDQALAERLSDSIVGKSAQPRVMTLEAFERKYGAIIAAGNIDIAANVKKVRNMSLIGFINKFRPFKDWDYSELKALNRAGFSKKQLSDFGNVHFGIMANAYGFRLGQSLYGAGFVQVHIQGSGAPGELHLATGLMLETEGGDLSARRDLQSD